MSKIIHFFQNLSPISYGRIACDLLISVAALFIAFCCRITLYMVGDSRGELPPSLLQSYTEDFQNHAPIFAGLTVASFLFAGYYKKSEKRRPFLRKKLSVLSVALLPWLLFTISTYFITSGGFSRGVLLFLLPISSFGLAIPRIFKLYVEEECQLFKLRTESAKKILIIGGAGYVGSQLVGDLLQKGYQVRIIDNFLFGDQSISELRNHKNFEVVTGDFRNIETLYNSLRDVDTVVHLAGIVGDPACSLNDDLTVEINVTSTNTIAEICKVLGIQRFIFASSCSVYGQMKGKTPLRETSPLAPASLYAKSKIASENILLAKSNHAFRPTILRFPTLFGLSPRPRFDLVVNILAAHAKEYGKINIFGASQWRPFAHVRDISKAIMAVIQAPINVVGGEIFNVGSNRQNQQIMDIADMIKTILPETEVLVNETDESDERNYYVNFDKFNNALNVELNISIEKGIREIIEAIAAKKIDDFSKSSYSNLKTTKQLIQDHSDWGDTSQGKSQKALQEIFKSTAISNERITN